MWNRKLPRQEPGQPIQAATINRSADAAEWATRIQADPPLEIVSTGFGPLLRWAGQIFGAYVAICSGGITARSGGTMGFGNVIIQYWTGSGLKAGVTMKVYNWNSAIGGIADGKYGIILRIGGVYWALVFEC